MYFALSRLYQRINIDLKTAQNIFNDTISVINKKRNNCDNAFNELFIEAEKIAEEIGYELNLRKVNNRQTCRPNYNTNDPQVYYRQSIYILILEYVTEDLKAQFNKNTLEVHNLVKLIPSYILKNFEDILNISEKNIFFYNKNVYFVSKL